MGNVKGAKYQSQPSLLATYAVGNPVLFSISKQYDLLATYAVGNKKGVAYLNIQNLLATYAVGNIFIFS